MRRYRTVMVGLSAVTATAVVGAGPHHARAAQTRATLQVTVRVVAPCTARVGPTGRMLLEPACVARSAPFAIADEGPAPSGPSAAVDVPWRATLAPELDADVRYITLLY